MPKVLDREDERVSDVLDGLRKFYLWQEAVVRDYRQKAPRGEERADASIYEVGGWRTDAFSRREATAVSEDQNGRLGTCGSRWVVNVQLKVTYFIVSRRTL